MRGTSVAYVAIALAILATPLAGAALDIPDRPTFHRDVLPILQERCQVCHREGGNDIAGMVAPMAFASYQEVRPWAKAISRVVTSRVMPPWDATDVTLGQFSNERVMTDEERAIVARWVATGAVPGDPSDAPEPKVFAEKKGWLLGEPDLVVSLPEPYWVADDIQDDQPRINFTITAEMLPEPRWIRGIEIKPDSRNVHHAVARALAPAWGDRPAEQFSAGSIAAGEDPIVYPEGFGNLLRPGTEISISMHYFKEVGPGTGFYDRSSIGFFFHPKDDEVKYTVARGGIGTWGWEIPPGHPQWRVGSSQIYDRDTVLISLHPHMHFRGASMKYTAFYPDGTAEVLLDVPEYDYAWQTQYTYAAPKYLPRGTRVEVIATYDNSERRKERYPVIDIGRAVDFGARSVDEMYIPFIEWAEIDEADAPQYRAASPTPQPAALSRWR